MQANTNNLNKTWALLQTTGGKDEANIVYMRFEIVVFRPCIRYNIVW